MEPVLTCPALELVARCASPPFGMFTRLHLRKRTADRLPPGPDASWIGSLPGARGSTSPGH
jgi:hypothetical protein